MDSQFSTLSFADSHSRRSIPNFVAPFAGPTHPSFLSQDDCWDEEELCETALQSGDIEPRPTVGIEEAADGGSV